MRLLCPLLWLTLVHSGAALGQVTPARLLPPVPTSVAELKPGVWVRYSLVGRSSSLAMLVRFAALERERGGQWFEFAFTDSRQRTMVMKLLVLGPLTAPKRVLEAVVQPPGQQALLLPQKLGAKELPAFQPDKAARLGRTTKQQVKVPAGTFLADHHRSTVNGHTTEVWFTSAVPGWPMVKLLTAQLALELVAQGTGARSEVRGKPTPVDETLLRQLQRR